MRGNIFIYIFVAWFVSYLIRVLPLTLIRKPIKNTFIRSFLYYVPYVTLSVMTFPAIVQATDSPIAGLAALIAGIVLAFFGAGLFPVAIASCLIAFISEKIFSLF
ncbi:MAG: AzlD domain-containing protein [Treponema sp.]|nr:AzlD domain-containing protein [Treponema sp.]